MPSIQAIRRVLALCLLLAGAALPGWALACCDGQPAAASASAPCRCCEAPKPKKVYVAAPAPAPTVICGNAVAQVNWPASAPVPTSAPSKPGTQPPQPTDPATGWRHHHPPDWALYVSSSFAVAGLLLLLLALFVMFRTRRGWVRFDEIIVFGGRGAAWEASRPLVVLVCSGVCFVLAVLLLLQLLSPPKEKGGTEAAVPAAPKTTTTK